MEACVQSIAQAKLEINLPKMKNIYDDPQKFLASNHDENSILNLDDGHTSVRNNDYIQMDEDLDDMLPVLYPPPLHLASKLIVDLSPP